MVTGPASFLICAGRSAAGIVEIRGPTGVRKGLFRVGLGIRRDREAGQFTCE